MLPWDHEKQAFDPPAEWPIERDVFVGDDADARAGLITALLVGGLFWGCVLMVIVEPWSRTPIASAAAIFVLLGGLLAANTYVVAPWRRRHPDLRFVNWLNRSGL